MLTRCSIFPAVLMAALLLAAPVPVSHAGQVTGLQVEHHDGQTFLTWDNLPGTGWQYHIFSSPIPVSSQAEFPYTSELGSVGDSSGVDGRMSKLLGQPLAFRTDSAAAPLSLDRGLFVTTPGRARDWYYLVTADSIGACVTLDIVPGLNSLVTPVHEERDLPRPIWQRTLSGPAVGEEYVLFTSTQTAIPGFPAMSGREGQPFHFGVKRGAPGGALILHGHGRGGSFFSAMSGTGRAGEWVVAVDDWLPTGDVGDFYYGYAEYYNLGMEVNPAPRRGRVVDYTDRAVMYLLDWAEREFGHNQNRVYAMGGSMGGTFASFLAWHHPERVAAALAFMPKLCFGYTPDSYPNLRVSFDRMWGTLNTNLPTMNGYSIFDWMDGRFLARHSYRDGVSPVTGFVGRNDEVVGWPEKVAYFKAMSEQHMGGTWYWDERSHFDPTAELTWLPEQQRWELLYQYSLDQSYPALTNCSADNDPGDGSLATGEAVGTINGYLGWDDASIVDTPAQWEMTLHTRTRSTRSAVLSPPAVVHVNVTPRRLQQFVVTTRVPYWYEVYDQATHTLTGSGPLQADSLAVLTIPNVEVTAGGSRIVLRPSTTTGVGDGAGLRRPLIALASNPVRDRTSVKFAWPNMGRADVELFDLAGRRVRTLYSGSAAGAGTLTLSARDLAPGVYLLSARQGSTSDVERVVVVH